MEYNHELEMFRRQQLKTRAYKLASYYRHRKAILERMKIKGHEEREPLIILKSIRTLFIEPMQKKEKPVKEKPIKKEKKEKKEKAEPKKRGRKQGVKVGPYKRKDEI